MRTGVQHPGHLFRAAQEMEDAAYLGDATFWNYLARLTNAPRPLVRVKDQKRFFSPQDSLDTEQFTAQSLYLTGDGEAVLNGYLDWVALNGIDRWLGGVHLTPDNPWRWDAQKRITVSST